MIAAAGPLQLLIVVPPPTLPIARITSPRAQAKLLVNHAPSECQTTYISSLLIQYFADISSTILSKNAKSLRLSDLSPPLLRLRLGPPSGNQAG